MVSAPFAPSTTCAASSVMFTSSDTHAPARRVYCTSRDRRWSRAHRLDASTVQQLPQRHRKHDLLGLDVHQLLHAEVLPLRRPRHIVGEGEGVEHRDGDANGAFEAAAPVRHKKICDYIPQTFYRATARETANALLLDERRWVHRRSTPASNSANTVPGGRFIIDRNSHVARRL
jgi:hypothetical protein